MALNPFLNLEQSRSIMQTALKSGFTGRIRDHHAHDAENLKDMNMSATDSMDLFRNTVTRAHRSSSSKNMKDLMDYSRTGTWGATRRSSRQSNCCGDFPDGHRRAGGSRHTSGD